VPKVERQLEPGQRSTKVSLNLMSDRHQTNVVPPNLRNPPKKFGPIALLRILIEADVEDARVGDPYKDRAHWGL
jgi:hypothetical protein